MIGPKAIAEAVREGILRAAWELRPDVRLAMESALRSERSPRGRNVIGQMLENARIAERDRAPLCQDTGAVWVWVELGEAEILGVPLQAAVDAAVAAAYKEGGLRTSLVRDSLFDRTNTHDNTPASIDVTARPGSGATVHVMLKGGGSDNASAIRMLPPTAGIEGVREHVLEAIRSKAHSACPPLLVGVGVGGSFDSVAKLSKQALLRPVGKPAESQAHAELEAALLSAINSTGIGPGGFGGDITALAVHVKTAPSHIASMPVAVNLGCCAIRSVSVEVVGS